MYTENQIPISKWNEDDKPATKILLKGRNALSDAELLSIIIGNDGSTKRTSLDAARMILNECKNNLRLVAKLYVPDILKIGSITNAQAVRIVTAFEIGKRTGNESYPLKEKIKQSRDAYEIFQSVLGDKPYEEFWIIMLNRANKVIGKSEISSGGISGTVVDPKKIFKIALDNHASSIILGHNHPSGVVTPSEADCRITKNIKDAGILLEVAVLDHIIVGDDMYYSFADEGAM